MRFLLCALLLVSSLVEAAPAKGERKIVNLIGCSIFDADGQLLKRYFGWGCAFFPNGSLLLADGFTLTFYDAKMNIRWVRDQHCHHNLVTTPDGKLALVLASNVLNSDTRIDRLETYDDQGNLHSHFDFQPEHSIYAYNFEKNFDFYVLPRVRRELTYIQSFYRIEKNRGAHPALAKGNFIASDNGGKIYFFDSTLKKIVHSVRTWGQWRRPGIWDAQVTKDGNILAYYSRIPGTEDRESMLEEFEFETGRSLWSYRAKPPFFGPYEGNVQILENGNVLFSYVDEPKFDPHHSVEITRAGKEVWHRKTHPDFLTGKPNVVKRQDLTDYFRSRGGHY